MEWIRVDERLPDEWEPVLGMVMIEELPSCPIIDSMRYVGNGRWIVCWNSDMIKSEVTHWMPLPEPPEEVKTDERMDFSQG